MQSRKVIKILKKNGWVESSYDGDHLTLKKQDNPKLITITHPKKDVSKGLLASIRRISGIKEIR